MFKILTVPNTVLTTSSTPVTSFDKALKKLVIEMEDTLIDQIDPQGVGLAAPQIGKNLRLFIIKPDIKTDTEVFINPKVLKIENQKPKIDLPKKAKKNTPLEGCLSIPRMWAPINRPKKILVEYQDITGAKKQEWFSSFKATIIQHEIDHLEGILFTQRAIEQNRVLYEEKAGQLEEYEI